VPELLRAEATRIAGRPSVKKWLESTRRRDGSNEVVRVALGAARSRMPWWLQPALRR
jgi:hypothetical protein